MPPCQSIGVIGSVLGLVGPVSVNWYWTDSKLELKRLYQCGCWEVRDPTTSIAPAYNYQTFQEHFPCPHFELSAIVVAVVCLFVSVCLCVWLLCVHFAFLFICLFACLGYFKVDPYGTMQRACAYVPLDFRLVVSIACLLFVFDCFFACLFASSVTTFFLSVSICLPVILFN